MTETWIPNAEFDTARLLDSTQPLSNDDPGLKAWIRDNGALYANRAVIGVREAMQGELVETWVNGPDGKVLERSAVAKDGDFVAVGVLGEQYIPGNLRKNKVEVGEEALRDGEIAPPLPDDGHVYKLWRPLGDDFRMVAGNPYDSEIFLLTSSGGLQIGLPGGKIAAQVSRTEAGAEFDDARFIAPEEFAASYQPGSDTDYISFGLAPPQP